MTLSQMMVEFQRFGHSELRRRNPTGPPDATNGRVAIVIAFIAGQMACGGVRFSGKARFEENTHR